MKLYFPTKRDWWLGILLIGFIIPLLIGYIIYASTLTKIFGFLIIVFILWIWFDTGYTITQNNKIKIKSGPFIRTIDIFQITQVKTSKNIFSSTALSLDRIKIISKNYDSKTVWLISPKQKKDFLDELRRRNLQIEFIV